MGTSSPTRTISLQQPSQAKVQDKGKGILVEPEKPLEKKDQINFDEEIARKLQAEFDEEEILAREKDEANLAQRLQAEEQELEQRRKHFAAKRAEDKRNKPPTQAQQRKFLSFKRVNTFVDFRIDLLEGSSNREAKIKELMKIIPDEEEVAIDVIPLATKEDLETLWKLIKAKYGSTRPMEDLDLILYGDLKTMFEPHVEDTIWRNQSDYRVLDWKLYDSY
ncbi:hypothetical protein Tco_0075749, partial [Tanacetum coccineum]